MSATHHLFTHGWYGRAFVCAFVHFTTREDYWLAKENRQWETQCPRHNLVARDVLESLLTVWSSQPFTIDEDGVRKFTIQLELDLTFEKCQHSDIFFARELAAFEHQDVRISEWRLTMQYCLTLTNTNHWIVFVKWHHLIKLTLKGNVAILAQIQCTLQLWKWVAFLFRPVYFP